jgi:hypothetical protein
VIITMEDGSSIQNVLDLNDLNEQLVEIHDGQITIKEELADQQSTASVVTRFF